MSLGSGVHREEMASRDVSGVLGGLSEPGARTSELGAEPRTPRGHDAHISISAQNHWPVAPMPSLHHSAYKGDLAGVLACITSGHSVHEVVSMRNQQNRVVCGITPLFLAAQRGHMKVVRLLVENGANPAQPSYIQGTTDLCTPAEVARLNLHFLVARYLKKAVAKRKEEDKVLAEDEGGVPLASVSQRPASVSAAGAQAPTTTFMANLGDLSGWDPSSGGMPPQLNAKAVSKLLKRNKVDLMSWRPDTERAPDGSLQMATSLSRVVGDDELAHTRTDVEDHSKVLGRYLKDLDLAAWDPEAGPVLASANASMTGGTRGGPGANGAGNGGGRDSRRSSATNGLFALSPGPSRPHSRPGSPTRHTAGAAPGAPAAGAGAASGSAAPGGAQGPVGTAAAAGSSNGHTNGGGGNSAAVHSHAGSSSAAWQQQLQPSPSLPAMPPAPPQPNRHHHTAAAAAAAAAQRAAQRNRLGFIGGGGGSPGSGGGVNPRSPTRGTGAAAVGKGSRSGGGGVAQRWFAHGSDSEDEVGDADVAPSRSVPLAPEAAAALINA